MTRDLNQYHNHSLHEYLMERKKKDTVPHYVGGCYQPRVQTNSITKEWEPTPAYARSIVIIHKPWHGDFFKEKHDWVTEFHELVKNRLPDSVLIPYYRMIQRKKDKMEHYEATDEGPTTNKKASDKDVSDMMDLLGKNFVDPDDAAMEFDFTFDKGLDFDWSKAKVCKVAKYIQATPVPYLIHEI